MDDLKGMPSYGVKVRGGGVRVNGHVHPEEDKNALLLADYMFKQRMANVIGQAVQRNLDEEEASRMNAAGVTLMQFRRKQFLGSAAAIWPYPRKDGDNIAEAAA